MFHLATFLDLIIETGLAVGYLSKSEHLAWSVSEDDSDLGQVGGALPEQASLVHLSSKPLGPVVHLVVRRVKSHTQSSATTVSLSADVYFKWSALHISPAGAIGH